MKQFFATEAAFRAVLLLFNLLAEFQRAAGLPLYREPATFRTQILTRGAILGRAGRKVDQFPNGLFAAAMMLWIKRDGGWHILDCARESKMESQIEVH